VNVLVGLEALKAGFGWSDQEMNPPRSKLRGINFVFYPC